MGDTPTYQMAQAWDPFAQVHGQSPDAAITSAGNNLWNYFMNDLILANVEWFVMFFVFIMAIRFGPALMSWFRHRNDPKQLGSFD
jgi:hypothetical protein